MTNLFSMGNGNIKDSDFEVMYKKYAPEDYNIFIKEKQTEFNNAPFFKKYFMK